MTPIVTLTTDFGYGSPYVAQLKGALLSVAADIQVIDATHAVPPQDVWHGAFVLREMAHQFPRGTVHIAVVDPGVGTQRAILAGEIGGRWFVAPDNGLLSFVAQEAASPRFWRLTNRGYWTEPVSATFHGRDIMAPVAAHLALAQSANDLGERVATIQRVAWPSIDSTPRGVRGTVVAVDTFGNAITNISIEALPQPSTDKLLITCGSERIRGLATTYQDQAPGRTVALFGSSQLLEIAVVNGSAARVLGIRSGDRVTIETVRDED